MVKIVKKYRVNGVTRIGAQTNGEATENACDVLVPKL